MVLRSNKGMGPKHRHQAAPVTSPTLNSEEAARLDRQQESLLEERKKILNNFGQDKETVQRRETYFKKQAGKNWQREFDVYTTRTYNGFSTLHAQIGFCETAGSTQGSQAGAVATERAQVGRRGRAT